MSGATLFTGVDDATGSRGATIDATGTYRYHLWRAWGEGPRLVWVMLNPSTADADIDDPTIRRVTSFTRREGYPGFEVVNLFGLRATDPSALWGHPDPVGPENDRHLLGACDKAAKVVVAWGVHGNSFGVVKDNVTRDRVVCRELRMMGRAPYCLGVTKGGSPRHPLYVAGDTPLTRFCE